MFYMIKDNKIYNAAAHNHQEDITSYIGLFNFDEIKEITETYGIDSSLFEDVITNKSAKFESFDGYDFVCLNIMNQDDILMKQNKVLIYMKKNLALFFCEDILKVKTIIEECSANKCDNITFHKLLYSFFNKLTLGDTRIIDSIEKETMNLEKALITSKKRDCVKEIISLRKRLMILKRYYEQLLDVLDDIQENDNRVFDKKTLRLFKVLENRIDRLYHNVLNLRDYVTQVREAYQAEVDISLNTTMKFFTVITSIFLPLTLIVGWYGMNLQMPEYHWKYGYLIVIVFSLFIVGGSIAYFKKNHWF